MSETEVEELVKKLILENMSVSVSITKESYIDGCFNVHVDLEYDGKKVNSYGDTFWVEK